MDERALERLVIDNARFEQLDAAMDVFCPFDAVGMSDQEVKHGRFLQYILDPARPHGFGAECLRAFMRGVAATLADAGLGFAPLDVHLMELDSAVIHRERDSIDLLIEVAQAKLIVAIELKINAAEHSGQLGRYRKIVERDWPNHKHLLLFLTKRGEAPSADGAGWRALSLAPVADALATVAEKQVGVPDARMMLSAYVAMLRREHLTDDRLEQLAAGLWREHREALEFLMERRPDEKYALLTVLSDRKKEAARLLSEQTTLTIVPAYTVKSAVRFAISNWDQYPGMLSGSKSWNPSRQMMLVQVLKTNTGAKVMLTLGSGVTRQALFQQLVASGADVGDAKDAGNDSKMLASTLFKHDEELSSEETFDKLVAAIAAFIDKHAAKYEAALKQLGPADKAILPG